jgi:hypothetical protein
MTQDIEVAKHFTNERLAVELSRLAEDIKFLTPAERNDRLWEAARRLVVAPRQVLLTLRSGAQVFVMTADPNPYFKERKSPADSWSLHLGESATPHAKGTFYVGEW